MANFDIGQADGLSIFTNNDDMFNISTDVGPSFILNQGFDRGIADVGTTTNVTNDVIADIPNEAPIDFIKQNKQNPKSVADLNYAYDFDRRKKIDSVASNVTIEAEPEPIKKKKSAPAPVTKVLSHPPTLNTPVEQHAEYTDTPPINMGFDDLLDNKKLKAVSDIDEAASIGGESQSTIKHENNDFSAPSSPNYQSFKPMDGDIPDSPLPSTLQKDRERKKRSPETGSPYQQSPYQPQFQQSQPQPQPQYQSQYQQPETAKYINEDDEKMDLLLKLKSLEERGKIVLSKHYNMKSSIDDIRMEYRNQTSMIELQASTNFMRKGLIFCTSGMEYMNRRFDPIGAKLDGWSENIMENVMDYDGIFERLHAKYKGSMEMEPEMELFFALAGSAFQFHLSQTFFKSAIPQLGQVLRENPSVIDGFMKVAQEAARRNTPNAGMQGMQGMQGGPTGPYAANDVGVGVEVGGGMGQGQGIDLGKILGSVGITSGVLSDFAKTMGNPPPPPQTTRDFREPPVNDLYRQMMQQQQQDDTLSVTSETSERSIGKRGSTKAVITPLPTSKRGGGGHVIKLV